MDDSLFSHSACQLVPEIEGESLMHQNQERILLCKNRLEESNPFPNEINDINGTRSLFPMGPLQIIGGMITNC